MSPDVPIKPDMPGNFENREQNTVLTLHYAGVVFSDQNEIVSALSTLGGEQVETGSLLPNSLIDWVVDDLKSGVVRERIHLYGAYIKKEVVDYFSGPENIQNKPSITIHESDDGSLVMSVGGENADTFKNLLAEQFQLPHAIAHISVGMDIPEERHEYFNQEFNPSVLRVETIAEWLRSLNPTLDMEIDEHIVNSALSAEGIKLTFEMRENELVYFLTPTKPWTKTFQPATSKEKIAKMEAMAEILKRNLNQLSGR